MAINHLNPSMNFFRIISLSLFFFTVRPVAGQPGSSIKTQLDKNKILIGEQARLSFEIRYTGSPDLSLFKIDSIPHFEILEPPLMDTSRENGTTVIKALYTITSFDSGHWVIPSYIIGPHIITDTIPVDVIFSDFDPAQDYHDIKDIMEINPKKKTPWWWYVAGGGLLLILALIFFLRKKRPAPVIAKPVISLNAYEEAMRELALLLRSEQDPKTFHSKLTDIFRLYLYRKKGILSLQKTTNDLVLQLKNVAIGKEEFEKLAQALRLSDFVKFAKYVPSEQDNRSCYDIISGSVTLIEQSNA